MRTLLLNPGPVSLSEGVRRAAVEVDLCHREPEYFELQDRVLHRLRKVYSLSAEAWQPVLVAGSGTSAIEAMIASLVPRDARLLVLENGVYGERLSRIAATHGIDFRAVSHGWSDPWDLQSVCAALDQGAYSHLACVHHETTTGRLNPVGEVARLCAERDVSLLLDAVSSFGAESLPWDSPATIGCAATANKCLHGIPGACLVLVRSEALADAVDPPRSLTLDLKIWADNQRRQSTPFTPPVNSVQALDRALQELESSGGWTARHARYGRLAGQVEACLAESGVRPLLPEGSGSVVLRAYSLPETTTYEHVHDGFKRHGFVIYAGQGTLAESVFRISTMGDISDYDMGRLLAAVRDVFG